MKILALDLSTNTGWACGQIGARPVHGRFTLPKTGKDIGAYAVAFTNCLGALLDEHAPDHVCFEAPILPSGAVEGQAENGLVKPRRFATSIHTARKLYGLAYHTEFICKLRGLPCSESLQQTARSTFGCKWPSRGLTAAQRRKHWKSEVTRQCHARGWEPANDDEADALCVWNDACKQFDNARLRLAF